MRRVVVYRYQPSWANFRIPYEASPELLGRLTPERAAIVRRLRSSFPGAVLFSG